MKHSFIHSLIAIFALRTIIRRAKNFSLLLFFSSNTKLSNEKLFNIRMHNDRRMFIISICIIKSLLIAKTTSQQHIPLRCAQFPHFPLHSINDNVAKIFNLYTYTTDAQ